MAYVPKAKSDIFTSYPLEIEEWVEKFQHDLKKRLVELMGPGKLDVYFAGIDWDWGSSDEMLKEARGAAILVATLVPGALLSDQGLRFFQQEWKAFAESACLFGSAETRFQLVLKLPIARELLAKSFPLLPNQNAFPPINEFYDKDGNTLERRVAYKRKVHQVAKRITERLNELHGQMERPDADRMAGSAAKSIAGMKALLAKTNEGLSEEWEQVRQLLVNDGVEVLLIGGDAKGDGQRQGDVMHEIERADLFVQLLDPAQEGIRRGEAAADSTARPMKSRAHFVYDCALAHLKVAARPFAILQWRPNADRDDFTYWPAELLDSDYIEVGSLQSFRQTVRAKLADLRKLSAAGETPGFARTGQLILRSAERRETPA
jgi:hypothetical protein